MSELSPAPKRTTRLGKPKPNSGQKAQRVKEKAYEKTPERFKNPSSFQVRLRTGIVYILLNIVAILVSDVTTMILKSVVRRASRWPMRLFSRSSINRGFRAKIAVFQSD